MWLPAVGLAILCGIAVVVVALPSSDVARGTATPVALEGTEAPPAEVDPAAADRVKPPEGQARANAPGAAPGPHGGAAQNPLGAAAPNPIPPPAGAQPGG